MTSDIKATLTDLILDDPNQDLSLHAELTAYEYLRNNSKCSASYANTRSLIDRRSVSFSCGKWDPEDLPDPNKTAMHICPETSQEIHLYKYRDMLDYLVKMSRREPSEIDLYDLDLIHVEAENISSSEAGRNKPSSFLVWAAYYTLLNMYYYNQDGGESVYNMDFTKLERNAPRNCGERFGCWSVSYLSSISYAGGYSWESNTSSSQQLRFQFWEEWINQVDALAKQRS